MSMTREEAIALFEKQLTAAQVVLDSGFGSNPGENNFLYRRRKEMAEIALTALRPASRERLSEIKTCDLVEELKKRDGVETHVAEPYQDMTVPVNGPAIVLVVTD